MAVLHLDCREAFAAGYLRTYRRLKSRVEVAIQDSTLDASKLAESLREVDDHGLIAWCFFGTGRRTEPFASLRQRYPEVWSVCLELLMA